MRTERMSHPRRYDLDWLRVLAILAVFMKICQNTHQLAGGMNGMGFLAVRGGGAPEEQRRTAALQSEVARRSLRNGAQ